MEESIKFLRLWMQLIMWEMTMLVVMIMMMTFYTSPKPREIASPTKSVPTLTSLEILLVVQTLQMTWIVWKKSPASTIVSDFNHLKMKELQ